MLVAYVLLTDFSKGTENRKRYEAYVLFMLLVAMVFMQGCRAWTVGGDLEIYTQLYDLYGGLEWFELYSHEHSLEIGFVLLNKLIYVVSNGNFSALLFSITIAYIFGVFVLSGNIQTMYLVA